LIVSEEKVLIVSGSKEFETFEFQALKVDERVVD
jgi:hypothetical protein